MHALTLLVLLGAPRVAYRRLRQRPGGRLPAAHAADMPSALLVGAAEDIDLFLRALIGDRRQALRVEGLLAVGSRQTGRRIHGHPFLGSIEDAAIVLERLDGEDRLPDTLVVATPDLAGQSLSILVEQAERYGMRIRRAPRPTSLDPAALPDRPRQLELRPMAIEDLLNRPAGAARPRGHGAADPGQPGHRYRGRRHDRQRACASGGGARTPNA